MTKLNLNLDTFGFVKRENDKNGKRKRNRCGRDGLYFVLHFFYPEIFAPNLLNPEKIEEKRLFGFLMPKYLPFCGVSFSRILSFFNKYNLSIEINKVKIKTNLSFLKNYLLPRKMAWLEAKKIIEENLDKQNAVLLEIDVGEIAPFMTHTMFIYEINNTDALCFDTWQVPYLEYKNISDDKDKFIMRFPLDKLEQRFKKSGKVFIFEKKRE